MTTVDDLRQSVIDGDMERAAQLLRDTKDGVDFDRMQPCLVIFDKDGTLIELYPYWSQMVALRARIICETLGLGTEHEPGLRWALGVDEKAGRLRQDGPVGLKKRVHGAGVHAAAAERAS